MMMWCMRQPRLVCDILPGLAGAGVLASLGIVPALMLTWNEPAEIVAEASRVYVFDRLPHHLAPLTLPAVELGRRLGGHIALLAILWITSRVIRTGATGCASVSLAQDELSKRALAEPVAPLTYVVRFAWGAALLALIGFAIELALWSQPLAAARLLRYYWFRLTDFAAPMAVALCVTRLIAAGLSQRRAWAMWLLAASLIACLIHLIHIAKARIILIPDTDFVPVASIAVPPADEKIRDFPAWEEACQWIAENTPPDALFLTPRLNHSFKWRAGRPEVVNRKDVPQDARSILEWHRRIKEIYYIDTAGIEEPLDSIGVLGTDRVQELAQKYRADYVVMDRGQLLSLPIAFWNEEYVVYRIED
jgi:hypothetical protein